MHNKYIEIVKSFFRYSAAIAICFIPGIFILDLVFKTGFFHNKLTSWIDIIFFMFWAFILSIPFHYIHPKMFIKELKKILKEAVNNANNENIDEYEHLAEEEELSIIPIKLGIFYIIYKFLTWQNCIEFQKILNISPTIIIFLLSLVITLLLGNIAFWIYFLIFRRK
jgi:hypothetical protein